MVLTIRLKFVDVEDLEISVTNLKFTELFTNN